MQSTMMNVPLTTAAILRHGSSVHSSATVRTLQSDGSVKVGTFAEVGRRAAQLANALRGCGLTGDERVATFMWNNQEHVEAYCAVPSMGAVLLAAGAAQAQLFADDDARTVEQRPVDGVVVVRMRQQKVCHINGLQSALTEVLDNRPAHAEVAGIDQRNPLAGADQHHGTPAHATVAGGFAGKSADHDVDRATLQLGRFGQSGHACSLR